MVYMGFAEAQLLKFTGEHQPSLVAARLRKEAAAKKKQANERSQLGSSRVVQTIAQNITKLKNKTDFKIASASRVRGYVVCNNCARPRCIYSQHVVSHLKPSLLEDGQDNTSADEVKKYRAMAKDRLLDAMESAIFMCGMAPLDPDDPCYAIFHCDPSFDCDTHIESDFHTSKYQANRIDICCHCDGTKDSLVTLNTSLKASEGPYSIVLPICEDCTAMGRHIFVRAAR